MHLHRRILLQKRSDSCSDWSNEIRTNLFLSQPPRQANQVQSMFRLTPFCQASSRAFWVILSHFESFWVILSHFESFWGIWRHFESFGGIGRHWESLGVIGRHLESFRVIWSYLEAFWVIFENFLSIELTHSTSTVFLTWVDMEQHSFIYVVLSNLLSQAFYWHSVVVNLAFLCHFLGILWGFSECFYGVICTHFEAF